MGADYLSRAVAVRQDDHAPRLSQLPDQRQFFFMIEHAESRRGEDHAVDHTR